MTNAKGHRITCINCGNRHEADIKNLKFRPGMKPYVCLLCAKGLKLGSIKKLEQYILENYTIEDITIVDFIINKLSSNKL